MSPTAVPISMTRTDWPIFIEAVRESTGKFCARHLDSQGVNLDSPTAFMSAIDWLVHDCRSPRSTLIKGEYLEHVYISFFVGANDGVYLEMLGNSDLEIVRFGDECAIMSGTLGTWKSALQTFLRESFPKDVRILFNKIFIFLEQARLEAIFDSFRKVPLQDKTFTLVSNH